MADWFGWRQTGLLAVGIQIVIVFNCNQLQAIVNFSKLHNLEDSDIDKTSQKFRSSFEYNNWMVSLAGYVTELLTNRTWEEEVIEKYYLPLELHNATFAHIQWYNRSEAALTGYRVNNNTSPTNFTWMPLSVDFMRYSQVTTELSEHPSQT